jgi:predicted SnoaL-like aldol condensation-catalyzing enzyme
MKISVSFLLIFLTIGFSAVSAAQEMPLDYGAYVRDFNFGNDEGLVEKYFAEDTVMISGSGEFHGHAGMKEFLAWAHDGVREILRPVNIAYDDSNIFVEVDMDFVASKERPEFPFGHLQPGDIVSVKFLVHYIINEDGLIQELQTMSWEPEREVSKIPPLGEHPGQKAAFLAYTAAFSAGLAQQYSAYYTDDVVLELPSVDSISGKQAIVDFYTDMFVTVRESLEINTVIYDEHAIVGDFISVFTASADAPDFPVGPLRAGEQYRVPVLVYYTLENGLISHIRVARMGEAVLNRP